MYIFIFWMKYSREIQLHYIQNVKNTSHGNKMLLNDEHVINDFLSN